MALQNVISEIHPSKTQKLTQWSDVENIVMRSRLTNTRRREVSYAAIMAANVTN
jgi:hypothetical protein